MSAADLPQQTFGAWRQQPPQQELAFGGFFGGNALTRFSGSYIDIRQVVQDLQTLADWVRAQQSTTDAILATYPTSIDGLLPGALYWDGTQFSRAPVDPSGYPLAPAGLQTGDVYYSNGVFRLA